MVYILRDAQQDNGNALIDVIGLVDNYKSLIINDQYYGQGYLEIKAPASEENLKLLEPGNFVVREVDANTRLYQRVMAIQDITIAEDAEEGRTITATGKSVGNDLNRRRVIKDRIFVEGNAANNVVSIFNKAFRNIVNGSDGPNPERKIDNFLPIIIEGLNDSVRTETINTQLLGENIAEWTEEICRMYGWGWKMDIIDNDYQFKIYLGKDRTINQSTLLPVIFSVEYDNLLDSKFNRYTSNYTNVAYIYGEDTNDGQSRKNTYYDPDNVTGFNRFERFVDSSMSTKEGKTTISDAQYYQNLKDLAKQEMSQIKRYEFSATTDSDGIYKLSEDYNLGDIVSIKTGYGLSATARITEIIYSEDINGKKVVPVFEEWEVAE